MSYERLGFAQCSLCGIVGIGDEAPFLCRLCQAVRASAERWFRHARRVRDYEEEDPDGDNGPEYVHLEPWDKVHLSKRTALLVSMETTEGVRWLAAKYGESPVDVAVAFNLPRWPEYDRSGSLCGGSRPTRYLPAYGKKVLEHSAGCGRAECLLWAARRGQVHPPWHIPDLYCWND